MEWSWDLLRSCLGFHMDSEGFDWWMHSQCYPYVQCQCFRKMRSYFVLQILLHFFKNREESLGSCFAYSNYDIPHGSELDLHCWAEDICFLLPPPSSVWHSCAREGSCFQGSHLSLNSICLAIQIKLCWSRPHRWDWMLLEFITGWSCLAI